MRQFFNFVKKEVYHITRDKRTLFILLAMPIIQLLLFGYAITSDIKDVRFSVLDESQSTASRQLVKKFAGNKYFIHYSDLHSYDDIEREFHKGKTKLVIVIPSDFATELQHTGTTKVQLLADASDASEASIVAGYGQLIISDFQQDLRKNEKMPYRIQIEQKMLYNPQLISSYNFVPGIIGLVLMLICAIMTSISIVREKEEGTMEVLLVSPIKPVYIVLAKAVPYLAIAFVNILSILFISHFLMDVPIVGNIFLILFLGILFIISALSLGLLISSIVDTQRVAMIISAVGLLVPTLLLSGLIYPIENMPWLLRAISNIIPAKWFISAVKDVMLKGMGFEAIAFECGILILMAVVLLTISIKQFKNRL